MYVFLDGFLLFHAGAGEKMLLAQAGIL